MKKGLLALGLLLVIGVSGHLLYLRSLAATETYPEDHWLATAHPKRALIVVAHDDDAVSIAGTISRLTQAGWEVAEFCFYSDQGAGESAAGWAARNAARQRDIQTVVKLERLKKFRFRQLTYRNDLDTITAMYMPVPYAQFPVRYRLDTLRHYIGQAIDDWQPTVLFTLDDAIGGYGNPDHVAVSQLVRQYCAERRGQPGFGVQRLYQTVFSPSLAENVVGGLPVYRAAKRVYQVAGMPLPTTQVTIVPWASEKKAILAAYSTEQNSMHQIWPSYHRYPAGLYFRIFDREFFRVLTPQQW